MKTLTAVTRECNRANRFHTKFIRGRRAKMVSSKVPDPIIEQSVTQIHERSREQDLDDRFRELRLAVGGAISSARGEVIAELALAVARMRKASNEAEWRDAVLDCGRAFSGEPEALELIAALATITAPAILSNGATSSSTYRASPAGSNGVRAAANSASGIDSITLHTIESDPDATRLNTNGVDRANADKLNSAAQRFARVRIAEIQLYHASAVKAGRAGRDLYGSLKTHIEAARDAFRDRFLTNGISSADYLHAEIVHALAHDDATLLGPEYPGPLA